MFGGVRSSHFAAVAGISEGERALHTRIEVKISLFVSLVSKFAEREIEREREKSFNPKTFEN